MITPKRPIIRYHGGKWKLSPWIISILPEHRIYVEPYGGAASVLLRKKRSYAEVYNDLDSEVVNLFRVARDRGEELKKSLQLTPFARDEFLDAWMPSKDALEQARRTVIRAFMGFGSSAVTKDRSVNSKGGGLAQTGFRSNSNRSGTTPAHDWANYPYTFDAIIERLTGVVIENRDALTIIQQHDSPETLFYIDPPYVQSTRDTGGDYRYEMDDDDHSELADLLNSVNGMVVLSGYPNDLYNSLYKNWIKTERGAFADGARARTEVVWINEAAAQRATQQAMNLECGA